MDVEIKEFIEINSNWFVGFIIFILILIPILTYWFFIRKKNLKLAKKIDVILILSIIIIFIGLFLTSTVRVIREYDDGMEMGSAYYYENAMYGDLLWVIGFLILIIPIQSFTIKEIKNKRLMKIIKTYMSIFFIIITFFIVFAFTGVDFQPESIENYYDYYNIGGQVTEDNNIELVFNNYNEIHFLEIKDNEIITNKRFDTNGEDNIAFTVHDNRIYGVYGNYEPMFAKKDVDNTPIDELRIVEIPDVFLWEHPNVVVDSNNKVHLIVDEQGLLFSDYSENIDHWEGETGYFIYNYKSKNLKHIINDNVMAIEIDEADNVYLILQNITGTFIGNYTYFDGYTASFYNESCEFYNKTFWLQKRDKNGNIIFNKEIFTIVDDYAYNFLDLIKGIKIDTNNDINIVYEKFNLNYYRPGKLLLIKMNLDGEIILNKIELENITVLPGYAVVKDSNGNLNVIHFQKFFEYYDYNFEYNCHYGLVDKNNNVYIFSIDDNYIYFEKFDHNGTLIEKQSIIEIPETNEYYYDEEFLFYEILTIPLAVLIALILITFLDVIIFFHGRWKFKKLNPHQFKKDSKQCNLKNFL